MVQYLIPCGVNLSFASPQTVDYFIYKPRGSGDNGNFGEFDLLVSTDKNPSYVKVNAYDFQKKTSASKVIFDTPLEGVTSLRFSVRSAQGGVVSCGEMEFYRNAPL